MALTFIIGNGFDLNLGLKTRYADFYDVYLNEENCNGNIARFKSNILKSIQNSKSNQATEIIETVNWADFEYGMGQYSQRFTSREAVGEFVDCLADFVVSFNNYLLAQCERVDWNMVGKMPESIILQEFVASIVRFQDRIVEDKARGTVEAVIKNIRTVNFLQFNYTNVFDTLLVKSGFRDLLILDYIKYGNNNIRNYLARFGSRLHVHGEMGLSNFITMGVDSPSQINNPLLRDDDAVIKTFVKQLKLGEEERGNRQLRIERQAAKKAIEKSDVICAFGVSFGETDNYWWKLVGDTLIRNDKALLVVFDRSGVIHSGNPVTNHFNIVASGRANEIIERFLTNSGMVSDKKENVRNRIIVQLDSNMFGFKLPML